MEFDLSGRSVSSSPQQTGLDNFSQLTVFLYGQRTSSRNLVTNSIDRSVRVLSVTPSLPSDPRSEVTLEVLHRFQDSIDRTPWCGVGFSGDGEYVIGGLFLLRPFFFLSEGRKSFRNSKILNGNVFWKTGAGHRISHDIYIWDRSSGTLVKVLEGPKHPLDDVHVCLFFSKEAK